MRELSKKMYFIFACLMIAVGLWNWVYLKTNRIFDLLLAVCGYMLLSYMGSIFEWIEEREEELEALDRRSNQ